MAGNMADKMTNNIHWQKHFGNTDPDLLNDFREYHSKNPILFDKFLEYTEQAYTSGRKRFSIWMIANRIRWYSTVETSGAEFKVSNDYLALYARLLMYLYPKYDGFFITKVMKTNRVKARE